MRQCPLCKFKKNQILHKQSFISVNKFFYYNVAVCSRCGFVYASFPSSQKKLDYFYKKNLKYLYYGNKDNVPLRTVQFHNYFFRFVDNFLKKNRTNFNKKNFSILDIGTGNGHQLFLFKKKGYQDLLGLDPSYECTLFAQKNYHIKVIPSTIAEYKTSKKFDLITLVAVLEHIDDLLSALKKISLFLKKDGLVAIAVPDTKYFGRILKEPFMEFSLEHINYFTRQSLINLFGRYRFENIIYNSKKIDSFGSVALNSIWRMSKSKTKIKFDKSGKIAISKYVRKSFRKLDQVKKTINRLIDSRQEIIIWGAGSLTARLFATTNLMKAKIKAIIDSNPSLYGKKINGIKILPPKIIKNNKTTIFISTYFFQREIKNILKNEYNYQGKIITL